MNKTIIDTPIAIQEGDVKLKYNQAYIEPTPTERYNTMWTIVKTVKKINELEGRRYLTLYHAKKAVDVYQAELLIGKGKRRVKKDLEKIVTTSSKA